ncbi:MAG TPA: ATP-binding cassette domain-containing protein [Bacilli bacterium]|nr:ATP-binding cassette domain-containing protein [Bacilli bacterium]
MIQLQNVTYAYQDGTHTDTVLHQINLTVRPGEWVAITGANGSGKSTLSRLFNGLFVPTEGEITVAGHDLQQPSQRDLVKQRVQLVFQNPDAQLVGLTPVEDVAFGLENRGLPRNEIQARIEQVLRQVGLEHKRSADVSTLSGGQKQRLAIASCLALQPDLLIFDEATSMLDPKGRRAVYQIARDLWRQGMTVIWVTQRLDELLEAERVLVMERGEIVFDGAARVLFYESELPETLGWEVPAVIRIGYWLQARKVPLHALPLREEGLEEWLCELTVQT